MITEKLSERNSRKVEFSYEKLKIHVDHFFFFGGFEIYIRDIQKNNMNWKLILGRLWLVSYREIPTARFIAFKFELSRSLAA